MNEKDNSEYSDNSYYDVLISRDDVRVCKIMIVGAKGTIEMQISLSIDKLIRFRILF